MDNILDRAIVFEGENACITLIKYFYDGENDTVILYFKVENLTDSSLEIFIDDISFDSELLDDYHSLGTVEGFETTYHTLKIEGSSLKNTILKNVSSFSLTLKIDNDKFETLESCGPVTFGVS